MKIHKIKKEKQGGFVIGALLCAVFFIASLTLFSLLLSFFEDPITLVSPSALLSFLISGAVSAFVNAKRKGEGGTLSATLSSLLASLLFSAVGLVISRGKIELSLLMNVLCYILVSFVFARLAASKKRKRAKFKH